MVSRRPAPSDLLPLDKPPSNALRKGGSDAPVGSGSSNCAPTHRSRSAGADARPPEPPAAPPPTALSAGRLAPSLISHLQQAEQRVVDQLLSTAGRCSSSGGGASPPAPSGPLSAPLQPTGAPSSAGAAAAGRMVAVAAGAGALDQAHQQLLSHMTHARAPPARQPAVPSVRVQLSREPSGGGGGDGCGVEDAAAPCGGAAGEAAEAAQEAAAAQEGAAGASLGGLVFGALIQQRATSLICQHDTRANKARLFLSRGFRVRVRVSSRLLCAPCWVAGGWDGALRATACSRRYAGICAQAAHAPHAVTQPSTLTLTLTLTRFLAGRDPCRSGPGRVGRRVPRCARIDGLLGLGGGRVGASTLGGALSEAGGGSQVGRTPRVC